MKTRTAPWDKNYRSNIPPTRAQREAEMTANCPKCTGLAKPIDLLPGQGVYCERCGILPVSSQDDKNAALYDQIAEARLCARFNIQL